MASGWQVVPCPVTVRFRRPKGFLPLPLPGTSIEALRPFVNTTKDDFVLLVAVLTMMLRGPGPYPVLGIWGEHGAAKSTLAKVVKRLVDPNEGEIRKAPKDTQDLMIGARNCHVLALDNSSAEPSQELSHPKTLGNTAVASGSQVDAAKCGLGANRDALWERVRQRARVG